MTFDPGKHKPDPSKRGTDDDNGEALTTPGTMLVAYTFLHKRDVSKNGNPFLNMKVVVIDGPHARKFFWEKVFIHSNAHGRLGAQCAAMRWSEPFDLESDAQCKRALLGRPFKAKIGVESSNGKSYAGIKFAEPDLSSAELAVCESWRARWEREQTEKAARGEAQSAPADSSPFPEDDEIPF